MSQNHYAAVQALLIQGTFSNDELHSLNRLIKNAYDRNVHVAAVKFRNGDKVEFLNRRNGLTIRGVVTKVNVKTVSVFSEQNVNWKVSPSLLSKRAA